MRNYVLKTLPLGDMLSHLNNPKILRHIYLWFT